VRAAGDGTVRVRAVYRYFIEEAARRALDEHLAQQAI
jgi:hypothetical protein